jgi:hypothetical protein
MKDEGADIVIYSKPMLDGKRIPLICQCKLYNNQLGPAAARDALATTAPDRIGEASPSIRMLMAYSGISARARASLLVRTTVGELSNDSFLILDRNSAPLIQADHKEALDEKMQWAPPAPAEPSAPAEQPEQMSDQEAAERQGESAGERQRGGEEEGDEAEQAAPGDRAEQGARGRGTKRARSKERASEQKTKTTKKGKTKRRKK